MHHVDAARLNDAMSRFGPGDAPPLARPESMSVSLEQRFAYLADTGNATVRRVDLATGTMQTITGLQFRNRPLQVVASPNNDRGLYAVDAATVDQDLSDGDQSVKGRVLELTVAASLLASPPRFGRRRLVAEQPVRATPDGLSHRFGVPR